MEDFLVENVSLRAVAGAIESGRTRLCRIVSTRQLCRPIGVTENRLYKFTCDVETE